ncbi:MAG: tRNA (5-methylaminomethyl-2-thiouridine)(34)-methyltransferase MnmD [Candidatus Omnitrophica bacterium]|nr:tRNA (5-methylaminomethyl-2-thiouridine)(34)-methyltransferase MnmD [Candidatus Omnitrophota bacterium]
MSQRDIVTTQDGSPTLYSRQYGDHYHSTYGAVQESRHVFIESGLTCVRACSQEVRLLEVGLGTGLNCILTAAHRAGRSVRYTALEPDPLPDTDVERLDYAPALGAAAFRLFRLLHGGPWEIDFELEAGMTVTKRRQTVQELQGPPTFDLVYYDAFSPAVQPEMWTEAVFARIYQCCTPGAVLVTYSSRGSVRRALTAVGFLVEKIPGPPGKREMVRARKPGDAH